LHRWDATGHEVECFITDIILEFVDVLSILVNQYFYTTWGRLGNLIHRILWGFLSYIVKTRERMHDLERKVGIDARFDTADMFLAIYILY
jgi:hypothetical protein